MGAILGFDAGSQSGQIFTLRRGKSGQNNLDLDTASAPDVGGPIVGRPKAELFEFQILRILSNHPIVSTSAIYHRHCSPGLVSAQARIWLRGTRFRISCESERCVCRLFGPSDSI